MMQHCHYDDDDDDDDNDDDDDGIIARLMFKRQWQMVLNRA